MATARDIVISALKKAGILGAGRAPSAEDTNDALSDLNDMLTQWMTQRWMVWNIPDMTITSTGAQFYTVGPGGDFDVTPRPDRIEAATAIQQTNAALPIHYPLMIIPSKEEYNRLAIPTLVSFPKYAFYDSAYPLGKIATYPVMNASLYQLQITIKNAFPTMTLNTVISLPGQYTAAIKFNLARRLRQSYGKGMKPDPELNALATSSLEIVKQSNLQIPELVMPSMLQGSNPHYNILSDQWY